VCLLDHDSWGASFDHRGLFLLDHGGLYLIKASLCVYLFMIHGGVHLITGGIFYSKTGLRRVSDQLPELMHIHILLCKLMRPKIVEVIVVVFSGLSYC